ncbi:MAG: dUTP diphosphatase [Betaproteobacteria bacterium AqS2]|uniref:dUTP diphosphatase n=1 Tax=Candidatus Amphirhobacter heronislandensis TaxID=1732024 RepID=A0A930Y229_9GAMM|nr:dUTP diphosphatase [Betaproteobacteria bacterium AqS2]
MELRVLRPQIDPAELRPSTAGSAACDLRACIPEALELAPGATAEVPTGVAVHIADPNLCGILAPRSGLGARSGVVLANLVGVIDSDYQGEIKATLWNRGDQTVRIEPRERVCQLLIVAVHRPAFAVVDEFSQATGRGEGGFGSTGRS